MRNLNLEKEYCDDIRFLTKMYDPLEKANLLGLSYDDLLQVQALYHMVALNQLRRLLQRKYAYREDGEPVDWDISISYLLLPYTEKTLVKALKNGKLSYHHACALVVFIENECKEEDK